MLELSCVFLGGGASGETPFEKHGLDKETEERDT